jgi:hypothetical protein
LKNPALKKLVAAALKAYEIRSKPLK